MIIFSTKMNLYYVNPGQTRPHQMGRTTVVAAPSSPGTEGSLHVCMCGCGPRSSLSFSNSLTTTKTSRDNALRSNPQSHCPDAAPSITSYTAWQLTSILVSRLLAIHANGPCPSPPFSPVSPHRRLIDSMGEKTQTEKNGGGEPSTFRFKAAAG